MSGIFWCKSCNVPLLTEKCNVCGSIGKRISADIRPVFPEEQVFYEVVLNLEMGILEGNSVWDIGANRILSNGKIYRISKKNIQGMDPSTIREKINSRSLDQEKAKKHQMYLERFTEANVSRLDHIDYRAWQIIKTAIETHPNHIPIVSFSGGKDSTVVSHLVNRYFSGQPVLHIFGDTTLELPTTYSYISGFKEMNSKIPFITPKSSHDFFDLCKKIGPPSRIMRWCCNVFKTGPIGKKIQ